MKLLTGVLIGVAVCLSAFGIWGCFTQSGLRRFNDADGVYPVYALIIGCPLFLLGIFILLLIASLSRKRAPGAGFPVVPPK